MTRQAAGTSRVLAARMTAVSASRARSRSSTSLARRTSGAVLTAEYLLTGCSCMAGIRPEDAPEAVEAAFPGHVPGAWSLIDATFLISPDVHGIKAGHVAVASRELGGLFVDDRGDIEAHGNAYRGAAGIQPQMTRIKCDGCGRSWHPRCLFAGTGLTGTLARTARHGR